jgi:flagellum-specific ATP synthase
MINLGAYKSGSNPKVDFSIRIIDMLNSYLRQDTNEMIDYADALQSLFFIFDEAEKANA